MSDAPAGFERVAVIGTGQLGLLVSTGLIACGMEVLPVQRATSGPLRYDRIGRADRALVAVGEDDLPRVLEGLPVGHKRMSTWLLQNELLPDVWRAAGIADPTVMVFWSEKKAGKPVRVVQTTKVAGPDRDFVVRMLAQVDVPAIAIDGDELEDALIDKDLYILTSNLAGLSVGGTVGALMRDHRELMERVAGDVLAVEGARVGRTLAKEAFISRLEVAFSADPDHACRGRTAEARLQRTLAQAAAHRVSTPALSGIRPSAR